jgi:hypothetical protein
VFGDAVEIALRIDGQIADWHAAIVLSGEAVQVGLFPSATGNASQLVNKAAAVSEAVDVSATASSLRGTVQIAGLIHHHPLRFSSVGATLEAV